jgi:hypothetical protein
MFAGRVHSTCEDMCIIRRNARRSNAIDLRGDVEFCKKSSQVEYLRPAQREELNEVERVKNIVCEYLIFDPQNDPQKERSIEVCKQRMERLIVSHITTSTTNDHLQRRRNRYGQLIESDVGQACGIETEAEANRERGERSGERKGCRCVDPMMKCVM